MSEQTSLFGDLDLPVVIGDHTPATTPRSLPARCTLPALLVLRDWLIEQGAAPIDPAADPGVVLHVARTQYAQGSALASKLLATATEALIERLCTEWDPQGLAKAVRHPRQSMERRIAPEQIALGVRSHIDALRLAVAYGCDPSRVHTQIVGPILDNCVCDIVEIEGTRLTWRRPPYHNHPARTKIVLPKGWMARSRKTGVPAPWNPPPEGFELQMTSARLVKESAFWERTTGSCSPAATPP